MRINVSRDMATQFVKENGIEKMLKVLESNYNLGLYRITSLWLKDESVNTCKLKGTKRNLLINFF